MVDFETSYKQDGERTGGNRRPTRTKLFVDQIVPRVALLELKHVLRQLDKATIEAEEKTHAVLAGCNKKHLLMFRRQSEVRWPDNLALLYGAAFRAAMRICEAEEALRVIERGRLCMMLEHLAGTFS